MEKGKGKGKKGKVQGRELKKSCTHRRTDGRTDYYLLVEVFPFQITLVVPSCPKL